MKLLDESQSGWRLLRRLAQNPVARLNRFRQCANNFGFRLRRLAVPALILFLLIPAFHLFKMVELRTPETAEVVPIADALTASPLTGFPPTATPLFTLFFRFLIQNFGFHYFLLRGAFACMTLLGFVLFLHAFRRMNLLSSGFAEATAWLLLAFSTTLMGITTRVSTDAIALLLCGGILFFLSVPPRWDRLLALTLLCALLATESHTYAAAALLALVMAWLFFGVRPAHLAAALVGLAFGTLAHAWIFAGSAVEAPFWQALSHTWELTAKGRLQWLMPRIWELQNDGLFFLIPFCLLPWLKRHNPRTQRFVAFALIWGATAFLLFVAAERPLPLFVYTLPALAASAAALHARGKKNPALALTVLLLLAIIGSHQWHDFHQKRSLSIHWIPRQPQHARLVEYLQTNIPADAIVVAPDSWFFAFGESRAHWVPLRAALTLPNEAPITHLLLPEVLAPPELNALARHSPQRGQQLDFQMLVTQIETQTGACFRETTPGAPAFRAYRLFTREPALKPYP